MTNYTPLKAGDVLREGDQYNPRARVGWFNVPESQWGRGLNHPAEHRRPIKEDGDGV